MYALRGTGTSVAMLADADDSAQWTYQNAFGLSEGAYMIGTSPAGDTIANFATTIASSGIDSYAMKILFGDWDQVYDNVNGVTRLISPQGFEAGKLAALSPQNSSLNKPMQGIIGTQKTLLNQQYSLAELQAITAARADLITNPCPGGSYYGARFGRNTSSNAAINGDNYTRMTNYIAATLNAGYGHLHRPAPDAGRAATRPGDPEQFPPEPLPAEHDRHLGRQHAVPGGARRLEQPAESRGRWDTCRRT